MPNISHQMLFCSLPCTWHDFLAEEQSCSKLSHYIKVSCICQNTWDGTYHIISVFLLWSQCICSRIKWAQKIRRAGSFFFFFSVFRSECLVVRKAYQTTLLPEGTLLSVALLLACELPVHARAYLKVSIFIICFWKYSNLHHMKPRGAQLEI